MIGLRPQRERIEVGSEQRERRQRQDGRRQRPREEHGPIPGGNRHGLAKVLLRQRSQDHSDDDGSGREIVAAHEVSNPADEIEQDQVHRRLGDAIGADGREVLGAALWMVASMLFSFYVVTFDSYNKTYGSLGAGVGFMVWLWISAVIVLIGAELNAEMEHQTARDTTEGNAKPLGARGAMMADHVGKAEG